MAGLLPARLPCPESPERNPLIFLSLPVPSDLEMVDRSSISARLRRAATVGAAAPPPGTLLPTLFPFRIPLPPLSCVIQPAHTSISPISSRKSPKQQPKYASRKKPCCQPFTTAQNHIISIFGIYLSTQYYNYNISPIQALIQMILFLKFP